MRPCPRAAPFDTGAGHSCGQFQTLGWEDHMGLVNGIWLAVLGILGASSLIIAKKPDAKELIAKLSPYQGWIGAVSAFWGAYGIISAVMSLGWLAHWPIYWITFLADS